MQDSPVDKALILSSCEALTEQLSENVTWSWDTHQNALLAEFSVDHEQRVLMNTKHLFPHVWTRKSLKQADGVLKHRAGNFGKLQENQLLLTQDTDGKSELMVAWWPWGHGATISMRIFRVNLEEYVEPKGVFAQVKALFS